MRLKTGTTLTGAGVTALVLTFSVSLLTGCGGNDPAASPTATAASTVSASPVPTATATKSPTPSSIPTPEVPAQGNGDPDSFMSFEPQAPITTPEQAIEVMKKAMNYNSDLIYDASLNEYGNFDVKVRSLSIMGQGGSGTAGIWEVTSDGSHAEKSTIIR